MQPPEHGDTWLGLGLEPLPLATAYNWAVRPDCGAVVLFSGTVRDHAEGRAGVTHLDYEAYDEHVLPRFEAIAAEIRQRWPSIRRIVILHRVGRLLLGESSVIVVVSSAHRGDAFEAGLFGIDTIKTSAPIWKRESWETGEGWALGAHEVTPVPGPEIGD
ncbi:MAG TPA: molybdenum cofactor biosynthesis protein MoaE [Acidimicrobiales bacterium]